MTVVNTFSSPISFAETDLAVFRTPKRTRTDPKSA